MRWMVPALSMVIALLVVPNPAVAADQVQFAPAAATPAIHYTVTTSPNDLSFGASAGYDTVDLPSGSQLVEAGRPTLPTRVVRIALPSGMEITQLEVVSSTPVELPGIYSLVPGQPPRTLSDPASASDLRGPDATAYASSTPYPAELAVFTHQTDLAGQPIAVIELRPVQYIAATGRLLLHETIEIRIDGRWGYVCGDYAPHGARPAARSAAALAALVVNPADVNVQVAPVGTPMTLGVGAGDYEYVVITTAAYVDEFTPLVEWKTRKGVPATIVTLDWITNEGGYGGSTADQIRAFVQDAYANWGTMYVLLGGDTNIVPPGYLTILGDSIPNDTHYGDFDTDWTTEVHVGRAAARDAAAITAFVDEVLLYEKSPPLTDYAKTAFFCGFDLDSSTPSEQLKEDIKNDYLPGDWTYRSEYDSEPGYHKSDVLAYLNAGNNLVNHSDHSNTGSMGAGSSHNQYLSTSEMLALTNGDRKSILYSLGCWACDFAATTCIAEGFVQAANGGGIAFVGNSRYGWYNPGLTTTLSSRYDAYFFRSIFNRGFNRLGEAFSDGKNEAYQNNDYMRYCYTELTLLGDPELPIWMDNPQTLSVAHDPQLFMLELSNFPVTVTAGGSPLAGATVCLWKNGEVYAVEQTGPDGIATFAITPMSIGTLLVTVRKDNYLPYEGTAAVVVSDPGALTITILGSGSVAADPDMDPYPVGEPVTLTASAATGWAFDRWEGDISATDNPYTLEMYGDKEVTAVFGVDCNGNGVVDALDLALATSADCNTNGIPDECDIATGFASDCNGNGRPDACDVLPGDVAESSGALSPIGYEVPQSYQVAATRHAAGDVTLTFTAYADVQYSSEYIHVDINGTEVGQIFVNGYERCRSDPPQVDTIVLTAAEYNDLKGTGDVVIDLVPTSYVAATPVTGCEGPTWIAVDVSFAGAAYSLDDDQNGVPDECGACPGDSNCDGFINFRDIDYFVAAQNDNVTAWEALFGGSPTCGFVNNDVNGDGFVNFRDIDAFVALQNTTCPAAN